MRRTRSLAITAASVIAAGALAVVPATPAQAAPPATVTVTFAYTGAPQTWTVPSRVTSIDVVLSGAEGGSSGVDFAGGLGGQASATLAVVPGSDLTVRVGGAGGRYSTTGGYNGGGGGGSHAGGGGTDVRIGGDALAHRVLVAGGGGGGGGRTCGAGGTTDGGVGGGLAGGTGVTSCASSVPGGGGDQSSGGVNPADSTRNGTLGQGADAPVASFSGNGAGGGGYYGGAAGSSDGPGGGGSGYGPAGTVFQSGARAGNGLATITYAVPDRVLTVSLDGDGLGEVTSDPAGIACGTDCQRFFGHGTAVSLTATPEPGSVFTGWGGECTGTGACEVVMAADAVVTATFEPAPVTLSVTTAGDGTVTSDPDGIDCGADCAEDYPPGTVVTLTPTPDPGSSFTGWSGACDGTEECAVTMDQAQEVAATFAPVLDLSDVAVTPRAFEQRGNETRPRLSWELNESADLRVKVRRLCGGDPCGKAMRVDRDAGAGPGSWAFRGDLAPRHLEPGRYRVVVKATADTERDRELTGFRVRRG